MATLQKLVVVAAVALFGAAVVVASAATLGGLFSERLFADDSPAARCTDNLVVTITEPEFSEATLSGYPNGCVGAAVEVTLAAADGTPVVTGHATLAAGSTVAVFDTSRPSPTVATAAAVIDGLGVNATLATTTGPTGPWTHTLNIISDNGHEFCANVVVSTDSTAWVQWDINIPLHTYPTNGVPNYVWNADWVFNSATETLSASGVEHNREIRAGNPAEWGFCADRDDADESTAAATITVVNDWGAGYCADVLVTTESTVPVRWNVTLDLSGDTLRGTPYTVWNATWTFDAATWTMDASGVGWNDEVTDTTPATFGFCANR